MKILVINAGSSSLKFQLFDGYSEYVLIKGHYDGIGSAVGESATRKINSEKEHFSISTHEEAIADMLSVMEKRKTISDRNDIVAVGHRVVHGGEHYTAVTALTHDVLSDLDSISYLAPLHNPVNISCIRILLQELPQAQQYGVFDTAFHQTMPEEIFHYALPMDLYKKFGIRKYGFHGTSHKYVSLDAAHILKRPVNELRLVTCHLGNGQSVCAVKDGRSYDTSMGFTPLEGLPMGTRSGSFDPEIVLFLLGQGYSSEKIKTIINKNSGLLGVSGISSDHRIVEEKAREGNHDALLANKMLIQRLVSFIGAYMAEMGGADGIVFTGGIGEHSSDLREQVLSRFDYLGVRLDHEANRNHETIITDAESSIAGLVIPTNEELQICREVRQAMEKGR